MSLQLRVPRVKTQFFMNIEHATTAPLASCPPWRRCVSRPALAWQWRWLAGGVACARRLGALGPCWQEGAERAHGCSRFRGGVRGSVVSPASVGRRCCSLRSFRYLSPWQRSVRWWERRDPHAESPGSMVFIGASTVSFALKLRWARRVAARVCGLRGMDPWQRSWICCSCLQQAASFGEAHRRQRRRNSCVPLSAPLSVCGSGVVFCRVRCVWWCSLRCVLYKIASFS
jgi:hypothetical protein